MTIVFVIRLSLLIRKNLIVILNLDLFRKQRKKCVSLKVSKVIKEVQYKRNCRLRKGPNCFVIVWIKTLLNHSKS